MYLSFIKSLLYLLSGFNFEVIPFFKKVPTKENNLYPQVGFELPREFPCGLAATPVPPP
jgi:hypothetical protein